MLVRQHELQRLVAVDFPNILRILRKQGDHVCGRGFEGAARNEPQVVEQRPENHRREYPLPHPRHYLIEPDRRLALDTESSQVFRIILVRSLGIGWLGPGRRLVPSVPNQLYAPDLVSNRFQRTQEPLHPAPPKPVVADVDHAVVLAGEIQRLLPSGVVCVEEERVHVRPERMISRLVNLIGKTVADLHPAPTRRLVTMIDVSYYADCIVVTTVTVDDDAALARHFGHQSHKIDLIPVLQVGCPFENEDGSIRRTDMQRVVEG